MTQTKERSKATSTDNGHEDRVAHIASEAYVERQKALGEPIYALCGAEIAGINAMDMPVRTCEECEEIMARKNAYAAFAFITRRGPG